MFDMLTTLLPQDIELDTLLIITLVTASAAGVAYALLYPLLSGDSRRAKRFAALKQAKVMHGRSTEKGKRTSVEEALKDFEMRKSTAKSPPLPVRLARAGLSISKEHFLALCGGIGMAAFLLAWLFDVPLYLALALALLCGIALPHFALNFLQKRRVNQFLEALPDAVDIIVRGVRAGLPLGDCMRIVAGEAREPVRTEFQHILHQQALGKPLFEAITSLHERTPLPESNFFCIVVSIQQKAGGNLSESLANLSRVLRERKKMKAKVQAMSQEAKSSAAIIAALPLAVATIVYITTPDYIALLWNETLGQMVMAGCLAWMLIGVFIMRQMINFDV